MIHEIVSFLCSDELVDYLSLFRRGCFMHKTICAGFYGVFRWPLLRGAVKEQRVVVRRRLLPGGDALANFPRMRELYINAVSRGIKFLVAGTPVDDVMRELRAALFFGHLGRLKKLSIKNVRLDLMNSNALQVDLPATIRKGCLANLQFITLGMKRREPVGDDEDGPVPVFCGASSQDLLRAMAKHLTLLRDFDVDFGLTDLSTVFLEQMWPSLTTLRSVFVTRQYAPANAATDPPMTFASAWARGHFPSANTLVVGEWRHRQRLKDLVSDLPTDGMPQITKLILIGRVLKSPLLNFRVPGRLTAQEDRFGGGGVIQAPLFRGVQVLDMKYLFVPVAFEEFEVTTLGLLAEFYENYAASFVVNTCRAVQNISAAFSHATPPTLVISDTFFGRDRSLPFSVMISSAISECLQTLRPAKLVVSKTELLESNNSKNTYSAVPVFLDSDLHMHNLVGYGPEQTDSGYTGLWSEADDSSDCFSGDSLFAYGNLRYILAENSALRESLVELEIDSVFLQSYRTMLVSCLRYEGPGFLSIEDEEENTDDETSRLRVALALNGNSWKELILDRFSSPSRGMRAAVEKNR